MSMEWEDLPAEHLAVMEMLGNFSPTVHVREKHVKGYTYDSDGGGKTYWSPADLRGIAAACIAVADWLDERAQEASA